MCLYASSSSYSSVLSGLCFVSQVQNFTAKLPCAPTRQTACPNLARPLAALSHPHYFPNSLSLSLSLSRALPPPKNHGGASKVIPPLEPFILTGTSLKDHQNSILVTCTISTSSPSLVWVLEPLSWCSFSFSKSSSQGIELDLLRQCSPSTCDSSSEFNPSPVIYLLPQFLL
jgi:hypothetical protein